MITVFTVLMLNAAAWWEQVPPAQRIDFTVAPGQVEETCMPLARGDRLQWRFTTSAALEFNVHHHVGQQVLMPVQRRPARLDQGSVVADRDNEWCLMWTAPAERAVEVQGAWSVERR
jgi:hypothetical protein